MGSFRIGQDLPVFSLRHGTSPPAARSAPPGYASSAASTTASSASRSALARSPITRAVSSNAAWPAYIAPSTSTSMTWRSKAAK